MTSLYQFETLRIGQNSGLIAEQAIAMTEHGGCICVLANTVREAQDIYQELKKRADQETETMLFHARFTMERRNAIEQRCLHLFGRNAGTARPKRAILVATQVVEQSLDLDFDGMITELAPIDLLLQRAGRVHRHRERQRPQGMEQPIIHVVIPNKDESGDLEERYGLSGVVYAPFLL